MTTLIREAANEAALADSFSDMMDARYFRLRLDKITDNACTKFHKDNIFARLVCTYRGTETHYGISANGDEPHHIFTVPTGTPYSDAWKTLARSA